MTRTLATIEIFTPRQLERIEEERRRMQWANDSLSICDSISRFIEKHYLRRLGLVAAIGKYVGPSKNYDVLEIDFHCWNENEDGVIVDASADQFGFEGIRIIAPDDAAQEHYVERKVLE